MLVISLETVEEIFTWNHNLIIYILMIYLFCSTVPEYCVQCVVQQ